MSGLNKDDIIRMARKAGMERCDCEPNCHLHTGGMGSITTFANLVAAAEREACAEVCELMYDYGWLDAKRCAREIRARREQ